MPANGSHRDLAAFTSHRWLLILAMALAIIALLVRGTRTAHAGWGNPLAPAQAPLVECKTNITADVTGNTTWTVAASPYCIQAGFSVNSGATLTIDPGVEVRFGADRELLVRGGGVLIAEGTPAQPITFTSQQPTPAAGNWRFILAEGNSRVRLSHCDVGYAGSAYNVGLWIRTTDIEVRNCRIHHTGGDGVFLEGTGISPLLADTRIEDNRGIAVRQNTLDMTPAYSHLTLAGNGVDALVIPDGTITRNLTLDGPGGFNGLPIRVGNVQIGAGTTLTVTAGTTLQFASNRQLQVLGGATLIAQGTLALPVTFTAQSASQDGWQHLIAEADSHVRLSYCDVGYAGSAYDRGLWIRSTDVEARHCRIHDTGGTGVFLEGVGISPQLTDTRIDANTGAAVCQNTIDMTPAYSNLTLAGNGVNALVIPDGATGRNLTLDGPGGFNGLPIRVGNVQIGANTTLTVTAGTTLQFAPDRQLEVLGGATLIAEGTPAQPITFTSQQTTPAPDGWRHIIAQANSRMRLSYCDVGYAGSAYDRGLWIRTTDIEVRHCRIHDTGGDGVFLEGTGISPLLADTRIDANSSNAVHQNTIDMAPAYRNLALAGNGVDALVIPDGATGRDLTLDGPGGFNGLPIRVGNVQIGAGRTLTVTAGTTLQFAPDRHLQVLGGATLIAVGTPAQPITFTSQQPTPAADNWRFILAEGNSRVRLSHCDVGYAGSAYNGGLWIKSSDVQVRHCRIHDIGGAAVVVEANAAPELRYNQFAGVTFGLENRTPATMVDARDNWWGHASGPKHAALNPNGQGVAVSNGVYFQPWLGAYSLLEPDTPLLRGATPVSWAVLGVDPAGLTAEVVASGTGQSYTLGAGLPPAGSITWDTTRAPDGAYELRVSFRDATGIAGEAARKVTVNNSALIAWHSGWVRASETWDAARIHVVEGDVGITSGITVTIAAGAVVKFTPGTGITVGNSATLQVASAAGAPTILTSLADDSAGGDTNLDGTTSRPLPGDWKGVTIQGAGNYAPTAYVQVRYALASHTGALAGSATWDGTLVHLISGDVTVPAGATLTIKPGAIIKLDLGRSLVVNAGGTLDARGTVSRPILFTSTRDDAAGGDTNQDGNSTSPMPGDWYRIQVNGGSATLDHVHVSYGAGTDSVQGALVRTDGNATLNVTNSVFDAARYTGILAWGGTTNITSSVFADTDRGVSAHPGSTVNVVNCTVDNNRIGLLIHGGVLNVANTLVTRNLANGILRDYGNDTLTLRYSDVWNPTATGGNCGGTAGCTGQSGNVSIDPRYQDADGGNYRLQYLSPVIDAADGPAAPSTDIMGAARYDDPRTANTGVPAGAAYADMGAYEFVETASSNIDLVVSRVEGPLSAVAGETVTLTWTATNQGLAAAQARTLGVDSDPGVAVGPWHDSIYLVNGQETLLAGEVLVAEGVTLAAGESATLTARVRVPGGVVARYHWQVVANTRGEVFEGQNSGNNTATSIAQVSLDLPELVIGGAVRLGEFAATGESHWFKFTPTVHQDILVSLDGTGGAAELYLARGYVPTLQRYDARSTEWDSPDATAAAVNTLAEAYYVLAYARSLPGARPFVIGARALAFGLTSVVPTTVGNSGPVTLQLRGGRLAANMTYEMISGSGEHYPATAVHWIDSTSVHATFNLTGAATGVYDVRVSDPGDGSRALLGAVQVKVGSGPLLVTELTVPGTVRMGRVFYGMIRYENAGDADMAAPDLIVDASGKAGMRLNSGNDFSTDPLQLIAAAPEGPAGILKPGQRGSVAFAAVAKVTGSVRFGLTYHTAGDTTPMDWAAFKTRMCLDDMPPAEWEGVWAAFTAECGNTSGGYVAALARYATLLAERGGNPVDLTGVYASAIREIHTRLTTNVRGALYLEDTAHPLGGVGILLAASNPDISGYYKTRNDGVFYMNLPAGVYTVTAPGYLVREPLTVTVPQAGSLTGLSLFAAKGGSLAGRITRFGSGEPLAEVLVRATGAGELTYPVTSDAGGYYRIDGLPDGVYSVTAGGGAWGSSLRNGLDVAPGLALDGVDFSLDPAVTLSGYVTRQGNGAPIAQANILLRDQWERPFAGTTDASGFYTVTQLSPGRYTLRVEAVGYASLGPDALIVPQNVTQTERDVSLGAGARVDVTVRDAATSQPLEGAAVLLARATTTETAAFELTDAAGQAALVDLPGGNFVLSVQMQARAPVTEAITLSAGDHLARAYALHLAGTISGLVTGAGGVPLANAPVQALSQGGASALAFTDAGGRYAFTELPYGRYAVSLWGGQYRQEVEINETTWQHTVDMALPGVSLGGRVVAANGATLVDQATVLLLKGGEFIAAAPTDSAGGYRFVAVLPGEYSLVAGAPGGLTAPRAVTVAGSNVAVPDMPLGTISFAGSVRDAQGNLLGGATVTLLPPEEPKSHLGQYFTAVSTGDGAFQFAGLVAGTYVLNVHQGGYAIYRQEVTVSGPGPVHVDVTVGAGHAITGRVRSFSSGEPLVGASVAAYDTVTHKVVNTALSDRSGSYSIADLPNGTYDLVASYSGYRQAEALGRIVLDNSPTWDIDLLPRNTLLHGQVLDDALHPVAGALVAARNSRGEVVMYATADYAGSYQLGELQAGVYTLQAYAYGFSPAGAGGVSLGNGQTVEVGLTITPSAISTQPLLGALARAAQAEGEAINGLPPSWFYGLVDYLKEHNPEPTRIGDDNYGRPSIPAAECPEAEQAQRAAENARANKDAAFEAWESAHKMYDTDVWTSGAVFAVQFADFLGASASLFIPQEAAAEFVAQFGEAANWVRQLAPLAASLASTIANYKWDFSSGPATINTMNNFFKIVFNLQSYGVTLLNLQVGLSTMDLRWFGAIAAFSKAVSLIYQSYASWNTLMNAADSVTTAQDTYFQAYAEMMRRLRILDQANRDCCDPEQECCPNSECCDPDCCQGSDCEPPPPPPPGGSSGGSGGTNSSGSQDPNDKATIGYGAEGYVAPAADLIYTVYFENVAAATAPAQQVFVTDALSPLLDWSSLELMGVGFNRVEVDVPPGLNQLETWTAVSTDPNPVRVLANLDVATGILTVAIESIDSVTGSLPDDPLAGFLPPNDAQGSGEGHITFTVRPVAGLASGVTIQNKASIVFDVNAPIDTPTTLNTVDAAAPTSSVASLPFWSPTVFTVRWSGSDVGSGVARYDVYVAEDGGLFERWQAGATATEATFTGREGHAYGFYSVATDHVGLHQVIPSSSQATTHVGSGPSPVYLPLVLKNP